MFAHSYYLSMALILESDAFSFKEPSRTYSIEFQLPAGRFDLGRGRKQGDFEVVGDSGVVLFTVSDLEGDQDDIKRKIALCATITHDNREYVMLVFDDEIEGEYLLGGYSYDAREPSIIFLKGTTQQRISYFDKMLEYLNFWVVFSPWGHAQAFIDAVKAKFQLRFT